MKGKYTLPKIALQPSKEILPTAGRYRKTSPTFQDDVAALAAYVAVEVIDINEVRTVYPQKQVRRRKPILHIL